MQIPTLSHTVQSDIDNHEQVGGSLVRSVSQISSNQEDTIDTTHTDRSSYDIDKLILSLPTNSMSQPQELVSHDSTTKRTRACGSERRRPIPKKRQSLIPSTDSMGTILDNHSSRASHAEPKDNGHDKLCPCCWKHFLMLSQSEFEAHVIGCLEQLEKQSNNNDKVDDEYTIEKLRTCPMCNVTIPHELGQQEYETHVLRHLDAHEMNFEEISKQDVEAVPVLL